MLIELYAFYSFTIELEELIVVFTQNVNFQTLKRNGKNTYV